MEDANNSYEIRVPQETLVDLYRIVDGFRELMAGPVQEATNTAFMTDRYETLETACGILGGILDLDGFRRLAITEEETRCRLRGCYAAADKIVANCRPDTDAMRLALNLRACAMAGINETYETSQAAQDAIGRILYMSQFGEDMVTQCRTLGPEAFRDMYEDPGGDTLHMHLDMFDGMFRSLQPRHDPEKNPESKEDTEA